MANQEKIVEINGLQRDPMLRARIETQMGAELEKIGLTPISAQVTFVDDNGPKGGPAMRCALTVHLPYRPALRVEHAAETRRQAFDGSFAALERRLERYRERDRESRRHPKKYYAAKRIVEQVAAPPARRSRVPRPKGG